MENPDSFCVKCLVNGDEEAFVALYNKYHRKIYYTALKMLQSEALAQDITQDVFLKVWEVRQTLDVNQSFSAFINAICRNVIFDIFKKAACEEAFKEEFTNHIQEETADEDFYEEYKKLLDKAISNLPPQRRSVFERCKLQAQSYDEVARSLGISKSTVQDHIVKANKAIRDYLQKYGSFSFSILYAVLLKIDSF
jgi:RNA polymerase sigma-70 factor (ECF subfamily)